MQKRTALGRGLSALIPSAPSASDHPARREYQLVPLDRVRPAPGQPRKRFDEAALESLAVSIRAAGVLQPIVVRRTAGLDGPLEIIAGERRWRAARKALLTQIPVLIKDVADDEALTQALEENIQRQDLNPIEEAESLRRLLDDHGRTQEQLAERLGRDRSSIANTLRLLRLPKDVQAYVISGELSAGHAKALLMLEGAALQCAKADEIVQKGLSVRATEALCRPAGASPKARKRDEAEPAPTPASGPTSPAVRAVEESLQRKLGTKVRLHTKAEGAGQIIIEYFSLAELERLVDQLAGR